MNAMRTNLTNSLLALTIAMPMLTGCIHRTSASSQPVPQAPLQTEPEPAPEDTKATPPPAPAAAPAAAPATEPAAAPAPVRHRKPKPSPSTPEVAAPAAAAANQPNAPGTDVAASSAAPATSSAIGELSAGDSTSTAHTRGDTASLIAITDKQLKGISRPLSTQEQKTASQVRQFLQQSREALRSQDVDAAYTLATKAKLLVDELLK